MRTLMTRRSLSRAAATLSALALLPAVPATVHAQALLDRSVRTGPQVVTYKFGGDAEQKVTQFAFPIAVAVPLFHRLSVDLATAYAKVTYDNQGQPTQT